MLKWHYKYHLVELFFDPILDDPKIETLWFRVLNKWYKSIYANHFYMLNDSCNGQTHCIMQCYWNSVTFSSERLYLWGKACWNSIPHRSYSNSPDWCPWLIKHEVEDGHLYLMAMVFFHLPATKGRSALIYSFVSHSNECICINGYSIFGLAEILSSGAISFSRLHSSAWKYCIMLLIYFQIIIHIRNSMLCSIY